MEIELNKRPNVELVLKVHMGPNDKETRVGRRALFYHVLAVELESKTCCEDGSRPAVVVSLLLKPCCVLMEPSKQDARKGQSRVNHHHLVDGYDKSANSISSAMQNLSTSCSRARSRSLALFKFVTLFIKPKRQCLCRL